MGKFLIKLCVLKLEIRCPCYYVKAFSYIHNLTRDQFNLEADVNGMKSGKPIIRGLEKNLMTYGNM